MTAPEGTERGGQCEWCDADRAFPMWGRSLCFNCGFTVEKAKREIRAYTLAREIVAAEQAGETALAGDPGEWFKT